MIYTDRFSHALGWAHDLHQSQTRKQNGIPYVSHLLAVAAMVIEQGGDEDTAIAALLHDAVEDQGGAESRREIRLRYGERVTSLVDMVTETDLDPKPPWKERKVAYLAHLDAISTEALLIATADKLHNAKATLGDYVTIGDEVWSRFNAGKEDQEWWYRALVEKLKARPDHPKPLVNEFESVVNRLFEERE